MSNNIYIIQSNRNKNNEIKASNIKTTDIRLQGKNVERILVDFFEKIKDNQNTIETNVKESITTTVGDVIDSEMQTINEKISVVQQTADKISLLVKSTDSTGNVALTDSLFSAIADNIKFTAKNIDLNGYVSNRTVKTEDGQEVTVDGNWYISTDGEMGATNLSVSDEISTNTLSVNTISNPEYVKVLSGDVDIYIDATNGNDNCDLVDEATFKSMTGLFKKVPKDLNGHTITIKLNTSINEDVELKYINNGQIFIYFNSHVINGNFYSYVNTADIRLYGGNSKDKPSVNAKIMPNILLRYADDIYASVLFHKSIFTSINYIDIYGKTSDTSSSGIHCADWSGVYIRGCAFYDCYNGVSANNQAKVFATDTSGKVSNIGWRASTGSEIKLNSGSQMGGVTNFKETSCGMILTPSTTPSNISTSGNADNTNYDKNTSSNTNTNTTTNTVTKTVTYKAVSANTYRLNVYTGWRNDGTARQGDYGYGDSEGLWFFGSQFNNLKGKTIKSVKLTIKRQAGGYRQSLGVVIKMHNYSSKPSGAPSYLTVWSDSLTIDVDETKTLTITDTNVLSAITNGKMKGFGIQSKYDKAHYAVCSGSCTAVVTYVE